MAILVVTDPGDIVRRLDIDPELAMGVRRALVTDPLRDDGSRTYLQGDGVQGK